MSAEIPPWLADLAGRYPSSESGGTSLGGKPPQRGEIWVATDLDARRRSPVLILAVNGPVLEVMLLSSETDMATDRDAVLDSSVTERQYALLALTDLTGPLWRFQLTQRIGAALSLQPSVLEAFVGGHLPNALSTGPPLVSRRDPRWQFRKAEAAHLRDLAADCARTIADGGVLLDPSVLEQPSEKWAASPEVTTHLLLEGLQSGYLEHLLASGDVADVIRERLASALLVLQPYSRALEPLAHHLASTVPAPHRCETTVPVSFTASAFEAAYLEAAVCGARGRSYRVLPLLTDVPGLNERPELVGDVLVTRSQVSYA
jgi:hypothetical protein